MLESVIEILNYITISQLLLFCIFFFFKKHGNSLSNKLLALFFLANAMQLLTYYFNFRYRDFFLDHAPQLVWSFDFFAFSIGPLLYLYTLSLIRNNFKIKPLHFLLFIPFTVFAYLCFTRIIIQSPETIRKIVADDTFLSLLGYAILNGILRSMNMTLVIISFIALLKYKRQVRNLSTTILRFDYDWFFIILIGIATVFFIEVILYIYFNLTYKYLEFYFIVHIIRFIVFNSLIFNGLKNSSLFESNKTSIKYGKSQLEKDEKEILIEKLKECMENEKYFLTRALTVQDVAEKLNSQPRYVSQVINEILGQNYIDFVNSYRIEEAKKMLVDVKYSGYSIIGILYEAGFNSKTAFNTAFKKQTGVTPKEFKTLNEKKV
jgi:AraC-like DNA-binding protein